MAGEPPIWLIGCGHMAGAMLRGWLDAGLPASRFTVLDPKLEKLPIGVAHAAGPPQAGFGKAIVQLGVKPQMIDTIAHGLARHVTGETTIVSLLAGLEIASLRSRFPDAHAIVRLMPNLPVALGKGAIGLATDRPQSDIATHVEALARTLGTAEWIDESLFDVVTALSGSGPAFLYRFIDALAQAGCVLGLDPDQAMRLAIATAEGSSALVARSDVGPAGLAERVASPGGTTRAGLDVLDRDEQLNRLVQATLNAAAQRSAEMAAAAR